MTDHDPLQTCSTTLYTRHLDTDFGTVRSLLDLARPMGDVHRSLNEKMARVTEVRTKEAEVNMKEAKLRSIAAQLGVDIGDL